MGDATTNGNGAHFSRAGVSWPMLILIVTFASSIGGLAYWLGQQSQQISINTVRIDRIEQHDTDTRDRELKIITDSLTRDSDIVARLSAIEAMLKAQSVGNHH